MSDTAEIKYPVEGKSVTGHDVIVVGKLPSTGYYVGELKSRIDGQWSAVIWNGQTGSASSSSSRSLDFASIGLEVTEENAKLVAYGSKHKPMKQQMAEASGMVDADPDYDPEDQTIDGDDNEDDD